MATGPITSVIRHLREAKLLQDSAGLTDGKLLADFISRKDGESLEALVRRHGPMVWGVCRRLLSHHDAEDAFQATLLVLVRRAASIASRELVAGWLHGRPRNRNSGPTCNPSWIRSWAACGTSTGPLSF